MSLFAGATIKGLAIALAVAVGALLISNVAWWVRASTLEASRDVAKADVGARTAERDAWKQRAGELKAANSAYDTEFKRLVEARIRHWLARNPWAMPRHLRADAVFLAPWRLPRHVPAVFELTL